MCIILSILMSHSPSYAGSAARRSAAANTLLNQFQPDSIRIPMTGHNSI